MTPISDTATLAALCGRLAEEPYITVDTEFLRDKTYWPKLCLIQLAGKREAMAVDPLASGVDLAPLFDLMANPKVLKVFHAARQDIEIFFHESGRIPAPLFDTQIAAMVCGFGDSVGYETLVSKLVRARIDKSSRFTDWSLRPLTDRQLDYALSDVTHLRVIYEKLDAQLGQSQRAAWLDAEMGILTDPATYRVEPRETWRRLKVRTAKPRFLAVLREVAAWRELEAQNRNIPRNRVLRDEAIVEIAAHPPLDARQLARTRGLSKGFAEGRLGEAVLRAVAKGNAVPQSESPTLPERPEIPKGLGAVVDLLKVLLKMKCGQHDVAQKLIASADELEKIAADDNADVPALSGWRREVFGDAALDLKHGRIALTVDGKEMREVRLEPKKAAE